MRGAGKFGVIAPIVAVIVRDLTNPNGLLRSFGRKLFTKQQAAPDKRIQASYTILDEPGKRPSVN